MPNTRKNPRDPDSPFVTAEGMAKAVSFRQRFPKMDTSSVTAVDDSEVLRRHASSSSKEQTSVRLSQDVITELRATGPGWPQLADELLRAALRRRRRAAFKATQA